MLPVLLFLCVVLYHGVSQQPARHGAVMGEIKQTLVVIIV